LFNNSDNSNADANADINTDDGLLGHLLNIRIKVDDNDSKTKAGMAYNRALK
jgi:hypothetical protein